MNNEVHQSYSQHGWEYDNGWNHNGTIWSAYVQATGNQAGDVIILERIPHFIILWIGENNHKEEVWSGEVTDLEQLDRILDIAKSVPSKNPSKQL